MNVSVMDGYNMSEEEVINCTISHEIHQYVFSCVYILVLLIGVPSNLYSLYHAAVQLKQKNELGVYLMNLTVSDLLYLASLPMWLQYIFQDDDWQHREWLCKLCGFLLYENIYISIGFLCCISLDRYLAVVHPLRFSSLRSMNAAWIVSAIIWLKEIAVGVVFFRHKELSRDRKNQSVCFEHYPMQPWEYPINYYRFTIGFMFPLAILSISYLCVLRAVGRSAGTQLVQKIRIRQLVSSTILIFLVFFSPYHVFLLVRTLLERDCNFIAGVFNYYHLSLLLTTLNCVADPALYCFVSESARRGLYRAVIRPFARIFCCCCRRGNVSPANPAVDSHEVAVDEYNGQPTVTLLTHTSTLSNIKADPACNNTLLITQTDEKTIMPLINTNDKYVLGDGKPSCVIAMEEQSQKTERTEETDKSIN
ncbi:ovarian cancer G-protein coupled receptor 1-like [Seriola lalandi dorsalis]|uniref:G protein-coupled receptor 68 n=1 Tax=Seriola lalandi dorsalis TaxID=1841481 RepID=A0A3B4XL85_SERLL|nr:ovarian cancer G-protein coupled receptor 1-like [Seriola lalandi dorsalis]XP_023250505.1 ovarian cancer G-protein coupled receptor 1-like [Seriola lalandi dorsalis]XP_056248587.1 ovarian cancer G-protein coupled receptor 1 [Seriola aureovittata]XP_056248588.1 ovarian cancer G-protein coupled receptor 1 [Seriola aureovittata]